MFDIYMFLNIQWHMSFLSDRNGTIHILVLSHIAFCILSRLFQHSSLVPIRELWLLVEEKVLR